MTLKELKAISDEIGRLLKKIESLRSMVTNTAPKFSSVPASDGNSDKLGTTVVEIVQAEREIERLRNLRKFYLDRLSKDNEIECCIWLHIARGYSWRKIANLSDGRPDTADSIRMKCYRYKW